MKILKFWKPLTWFIIICFLSLMPGDQLPAKPFLNIPHFDKFVHSGIYFIFCLLLIKPVKTHSSVPLFVSAIISAVLSGIIEILQQEISKNRSGSIFDLLANILGIILAVLVFNYFVSGNKIEKLI